MKKTTKFSRKRQATGGAYDGGAYITVLQKCRAYTAEPIPGTSMVGTITAATKSMLKVREAYVAIKTRTTVPANTHDFDLLTRALAVATIRGCQIGGTDPACNPILPVMVTGNAALRRLLDRRRATGQWGFDGPAIEEVAEAIDIYDLIISQSTPAQMMAADDIRLLDKFGAVRESLEPLA